ncbi:MAG: Calx-beta domain-containing protein, partial [Planctomycetota bacterium]
PGSDYTWIPGGSSAAGDVTILAGETTGSVTVTPSQDSAVEGTETIALALGAPTNGTLGSGSTHQMLLIDDDGPAVTVGFVGAASQVMEADGSATVELLLSDYAPQPVDVPFTTGGSADLGVDYTLGSTTVSIPVGSLSAAATVTLVDDTDAEGDETIVLTMGTPTGAIAGSPSMHTITLQDDDGVPTVDFALPTSSFSEGSGTVDVAVQLSSAAATPVEVTLAIGGTAAGAGEDYTIGVNPITIPAGDSVGVFSVDLVQDNLFESDETIELTLASAVGADLGTATVHTLSVTNDDAEPVVQFTAFRSVVAEADGGFNLRLVLDGPSGLPVSVPFTASGDGSGPGDATLPPSPAVIPAGDTFVDLPVTLVVDRIPELGERILFELGAPQDATLGTISSQLFLLSDGDRGPFLLPDALAPSATSLQFPTTRAFESTPAQALFFSNLNSVPLTVTDVVRVGSMKGDFVLSYPVPLPITLQPGTGFQVDVHFEPMGAGERSLNLRAETTEVTGPATTVMCEGIAYGVTGDEVQMNMADVAFDGPAREDYTAEYGATGGNLGFSSSSVVGTSLDGLYQTFRVGPQFSYSIELPNGAYDVTLRAWEPVQTQVVARVMDVFAEGSLLLNDVPACSGSPEVNGSCLAMVGLENRTDITFFK